MRLDSSEALLSVIVVAGDRRDRMRKMLAALAAQTGRDKLEIIIVDAASEGAPALSLPLDFQVRVLRTDAGVLPGKARFEGTRNATAPYVAFLEDHCYPEPDWSDAIIKAHRAGWAAVGYAFSNGSPDSYLYRAIFLAEYGMWSHARSGGPTTRLPGCNVSYQKAELLVFNNRWVSCSKWITFSTKVFANVDSSSI